MINKFVGFNTFDVRMDYIVCYVVGRIVKAKERCWMVPPQLITDQKIRTALDAFITRRVRVLSNGNVRNLQEHYRLIVEMVYSDNNPNLKRKAAAVRKRFVWMAAMVDGLD